MTNAFLRQVLSLPKKAQRQVEREWKALAADPYPDGHQKVRVKRYEDIYRARAGSYRILYRIRTGKVDLIALALRRDAYEKDSLPEDTDYVLLEDPDAEALAEELAAAGDDEAETDSHDSARLDHAEAPGDDVAVPLSYPPGSVRVDESQVTEIVENEPLPVQRPLPRPITEDLLRRLRIPPAIWPALVNCDNEDALETALLRVDTVHASRLIDAVFGVKLDDVIDEPTYAVPEAVSAEEILHGRVPLRLDLDPHQREVLDAIRRDQGPFIVTGGPGTGKTNVALYSVATLLERLRAEGVAEPRILYVTYTRTLQRTAERMLRHLLTGRDRFAVEARTLDEVVWRLVGQHAPAIADEYHLRALVREARQQAFVRPLSSTPEDDRRMARAITAINDDYIRDEIEEVIVGRDLRSVEEYLSTDRAGRRVPLNEAQRRAVWCIFEVVARRLDQDLLSLSGQRRLSALDTLRSDPGAPRYHAVIADEVQDFDLVAIRILRELCRDRSHLVLCGDSGQSLYSRTFRWRLVEPELDGPRRLRLGTGHRCPPEIVAAARTYLDHLPESDVEGDEATTTHRKRAGRTRPRLVMVDQWRTPSGQSDRYNRQPIVAPAEDAWVTALVEQLEEAQGELRVLPGRCAVLAPRNQDAQSASTALHARGIANERVERGQPVTEHNAVKVLTWHNAKGLEFDVVIVLMPDWQPPPAGWSAVLPEHQREVIELWRRAAYVAMTRATRWLTVVRPSGGSSMLLDGFDTGLWELVHRTGVLHEIPDEDLPF